MSAALLTRPDVGTADRVGDELTSAPRLPLYRRIPKHPRVMHYHRLAALVLAVNLALALYAAAVCDWWTPDGTPEVSLSCPR